jgi:uncharacterized Zn-finger protein
MIHDSELMFHMVQANGDLLHPVVFLDIM